MKLAESQSARSDKQIWSAPAERSTVTALWICWSFTLNILLVIGLTRCLPVNRDSHRAPK